MSKTYRSASLELIAVGTRAEAIKKVIGHMEKKDSVRSGSFYGRFTFRADDDSGFTISIFNGSVKCVLKWNASRNA